MGTKPLSIFRLGRVALKLGRVSNLPTVVTNVLCAAFLSRADVNSADLAVMVLAGVLVYISGMFLNDVFDAKHDREYQPFRPIPRGEIKVHQVFVSGILLMLLALSLFLFWQQWKLGELPELALISVLGLILMILVYDYHHKKNPLAPIIMGLGRLFLFLAVTFSLTTFPDPMALVAGIIVMIYTMSLTYVARWGAPPTTVARMIAGISLIDGVLLSVHWHPFGLLIGFAGFATTLYLQTWVRGT